MYTNRQNKLKLLIINKKTGANPLKEEMLPLNQKVVLFR